MLAEELRDPYFTILGNGGGLYNRQITNVKLGNISTTKKEGSGIGLSTLYNYCDKLGWALELKTISVPDELNKKGLKVTISLTSGKL